MEVENVPQDLIFFELLLIFIAKNDQNRKMNNWSWNNFNFTSMGMNYWVIKDWINNRDGINSEYN